MINPDTLIDAWVTTLSGIPDLNAALGGNERITGYKDAFPAQENLRRAILAQPSGSILVVFMGTDKVRMGNGGAWSFRHKFSFTVKAGGDASYGAIWSAFVNGVPSAGTLPVLHTDIHPDCDGMDREGPSSQRSSLLISMDGETLDYFEFSASLIERFAS